MNLLAPFFKGLTHLRVALYQKNRISSIELPIPVISIGNLTMGGTGKTPFTLCLLEKYQQQYKIGVVVRSYKAKLKEPKRVELNHISSETFGDEAVLIQKKMPQVIVYSGPCKFKTAQKLYDEERPDFIIVDDGFQHLKLKRNLDIVLLDTSVVKSDYSWPPSGRMREDFSALDRASIIVLTKTEMQNEQTLAYLKKQIPSSALVLEAKQAYGKLVQIAGQKFSGLDSDLRTESSNLQPSQSQHHLSGIKIESGAVRNSEPRKCDLTSGADFKDKTEFKDKKVFAFAGLARPQNFRTTLERLNIPVQKFLGLHDHVNYTEELIKDICEQAKNYDFCMTTEKDAVKLQQWPDTASSLFTVPIELELKGNLEGFYEKIDECIRKKL
jgi:tetraacyldisaccharide 4'-kinase